MLSQLRATKQRAVAFFQLFAGIGKTFAIIQCSAKFEVKYFSPQTSCSLLRALRFVTFFRQILLL